jgi:hypothetical protein
LAVARHSLARCFHVSRKLETAGWFMGRIGTFAVGNV